MAGADSAMGSQGLGTHLLHSAAAPLQSLEAGVWLLAEEDGGSGKGGVRKSGECEYVV